MSKLMHSVTLPHNCATLATFTMENINICYIVIGMYELVDGKRLGGIEIYSVDYDNSKLKLIDSVMNCGVFRLKIVHVEDGGIEILAAHIDNCVRSYKFENGAVCMLWECDLCPQSSKDCTIMATCVDVTKSSQFCAADNCGNVYLAEMNSQVENSWKAHPRFEIWSICRLAENIISTGADDSYWKWWDIRDLQRYTFCSKEHKAGVTHILSLSDSLIATGSYEDVMRIWDNRNMKSPRDSFNIGGGVWDIKLRGNDLLVAAMYNGWKKLTFEDCNFSKVKQEIHVQNGTNILYGIDFLSEKCNDSIVCCSFYDKVVSVYGP